MGFSLGRFYSSIMLLLIGLMLGALAGCDTDSDAAALRHVVVTRPAAVFDSPPLAIAPLRNIGDAFGSAVTLSGDGLTLAISAPLEDGGMQGEDGDTRSNDRINSGAVYLFRNLNGRWQQQAYLKASHRDMDDQFGRALSLNNDGTLLAVSAPNTDGLGYELDSGSVYLFYRTGDQWQQQDTLKASNATRFARFGSALSLSADGKTLAIAALGADNGHASGGDNRSSQVGAVYLYRHQATGWQQQAVLKANQPRIADRFGGALSLSADGRLLAVGAERDEDHRAKAAGQSRLANAGAVYLYRWQADQWQLDTHLKASHPRARDNFGAAVSLSADGKRLAVGAQGEALDATAEQPKAPNAGAVYVFEERQGQWQLQAHLNAHNAEAHDGFGARLQLSAQGKTLIASALWEDGAVSSQGADDTDNKALQAGAVYLFEWQAGQWQQQAYLKADRIRPFDHFGSAITLSADGETLVVGVPTDDSVPITDLNTGKATKAPSSGAAYVFHRTELGWNHRRYLKVDTGSMNYPAEALVRR